MSQNRAAQFITHEVALAQGYVSTPGGYRLKSFVHPVGVDQAVAKRPGASQLMNLVTSSLVGSPAVSTSQDLAGLGGGWVTWAIWTNATGVAISSFATSWVVPPAPSSDSGQLIYLFNGLQDQTGGEILQPVLQWGVSGAGGGSYWSVASWHVDSNGHAFCTPTVPVHVGDALIGLMTLSVQGDGSLNYACQFKGIPGTSLLALGLADLVQATETLEVYNLTGSTDYPHAQMTAMSGIDIQLMGNPAPLGWVANVMSNPAFGEHTTIVSNATPGGEVDLYY